MSFIYRFFSFLSLFDLYGTPMAFYIEKKRTVTSRFGGAASMLIMALALYILGVNIREWLILRIFKVVSSTNSVTPAELLARKTNTSFTFTAENYFLYFAISADLGNSVWLEYYNLSRYITPRMTLVDENLNIRELALENCWRKKQFEFLEKPYTGADDARGSAILCLQDDVTMGLFPSQAMQYILDPKLIFEIVKCQNSTANNFSCASNEEIENILPLIEVQVSVPRSNYDFTDTVHPRRRTIDNEIYHLDYSLLKSYTAWLMTSVVESDFGIINTDYKQDTMDFNTHHLLYETNLRNKEKNDVFMSYNIWFGFNAQTYYRQNTKLLEIIGNFGGTINVLLALGRIVCTFYNYYVMKHKLINIAFEKEELEEEDSLSKNKR